MCIRDSIDDCINFNFNYESMRSRLASHRSNNSTNNPNTNVDLVPITFGNIISRVNNHNKNSKLKKVKKKNDTIVSIIKKIITKTSQLRFYWIRAQALR